MSRRETRMMGGPRPFPETCWSLLQKCIEPDSQAPPGSRHEGLDRLFRSYWGPVYLYVRRNWNKDIEEAKELTQAFFVTFLEKDFIASFDADRGRFRTFVCAALKHWLAKQHRAEHAQKRRPDAPLLSFDALKLDDTRFDVPAPELDSADAQFDADWKRAVIDAAVERMRRFATGTAKEPYVDMFVRYDLDRLPTDKLTYAELAEPAGLTVYQVTTGLHWARRAFAEALKDEIREQVGGEADLQAEAEALFGRQL